MARALLLFRLLVLVVAATHAAAIRPGPRALLLSSEPPLAAAESAVGKAVIGGLSDLLGLVLGFFLLPFQFLALAVDLPFLLELMLQIWKHDRPVG